MDGKTIYKYPLKITDVQEIELPVDYQILSAQLQNGVINLWALVDPCVRKYKITILIHGTGHPLASFENKKFISTVQQGPLVWHIFERIN